MKLWTRGEGRQDSRADDRIPNNIHYDDLRKLCVEHFGEPRQEGSSHAVFKTPWPGDPRVNIQRGKNGMAKPCQVRQVQSALEKKREEESEQT
jgi:hypothetical protein